MTEVPPDRRSVPGGEVFLWLQGIPDGDEAEAAEMFAIGGGKVGDVVVANSVIPK